MSEIRSVSVVPIESINLADFHIIDVRSPKEFQEFHIEGATNVPIFSNEEREKVGTTYKQVGKEEAKMLGLSIVSPKLPQMVELLKGLAVSNRKPYLIYCARGGMRSNSFATVMKLMGLDCCQLIGGIRSYRQFIMAKLEQYSKTPKPFIVLEGLTGTRKTDILEVLQEEGYPVINLEKLAGHRGSIFGEIGNEGRSQKMFDRDLFRRLQQIDQHPNYIIESESKRIGRVVVPDWILNGKEEGKRLHIHYPLESRVQSICETYQPELFHDQIGEALHLLKKRLASEVYERILLFFHDKDYENVVRVLLMSYYDPKYNFTADQYRSPVIELAIENLEDGLVKVKNMIQKLQLHSYC
ncbi:tRNA 2-selenouridine(34) synthase MnmH [Alkalihalobacillus sp. TS-13]|uniref:tRNA 2-selenouridine(34) synthase MnmH n=1 Tax=Alkalihalobacillus sp. TS-13 TaxID=2842455 RepID=UPI001C8696CF|nr:tRNA 2-selenouridine(34) synthase MnmH [Alkalihalobacillus sp. TS-13]